MTNTEETTLVSEGQRLVISISLPKNPKSPSRKVTFEPDEGKQYGPSGWTYEDQLGGISIGQLAEYRIEKNAEGFHKLTHIAPVTTQKGSGGAEAQTPTAAPPPDGQGRGDAVGGGGSGPSPTAERDKTYTTTDPATGEVVVVSTAGVRAVPNSDTARFEGWGYAGTVGIVNLTFGELSDAVEGGDLDKIDAVLQRRTAEVLLNAADQAQRALVGRTDRSALSHKAARDAVRAVVDKRPLRGGIQDIPAWAADVERTAVRLLQLAATL